MDLSAGLPTRLPGFTPPSTSFMSVPVLRLGMDFCTNFFYATFTGRRPVASEREEPLTFRYGSVDLRLDCSAERCASQFVLDHSALWPALC